MLRKFLVPEFVYGEGSLDLAGRYVRNIGATRVLVVTDPGVAAAGWSARVVQSLDAEGLFSTVFSGVTPNPREDQVAAGAQVLRENRCDAIVAVGGGSPMDCAKGIGIVIGNGEPISQFEGVDEVALPGPPLLCIPTTAGTAAEVSQFAIIRNVEQQRKYAIVSKKVVPDVALIDPRTLVTTTPELRACTGMDVLSHALESLASNASSPITSVHALEAVRLVQIHARQAVREATPEALQGMMLASLEAGMAFSNTSLGAVHAISHSLGGLLDSPHGWCNAQLLRSVVDFNFDASLPQYRMAATAFGVDIRGMTDAAAKAAFTAAIDALVRDVGIELSLTAGGVRRDDVRDLAKNAMRDPCLITNPRQPNQRDLEVILEECL